MWVLSAFLDRADGELARMTGMTSPRGHTYDYASDVVVNGLVFVAIGYALGGSTLGWAGIALGVTAGGSVAIASLLSEALERSPATVGRAYEGRGGFDFDDVLYLLGPIAWVGWLLPLLVGASIGGPVFAILTYVRLRRAQGSISAKRTGLAGPRSERTCGSTSASNSSTHR